MRSMSENIFRPVIAVISVIKDKETALHDAVEEAEKKLADKGVSIHQRGSACLQFPIINSDRSNLPVSTDVQTHKHTCEQLQRELAEQAENMLTVNFPRLCFDDSSMLIIFLLVVTEGSQIRSAQTANGSLAR